MPPTYPGPRVLPIPVLGARARRVALPVLRIPGSRAEPLTESGSPRASDLDTAGVAQCALPFAKRFGTQETEAVAGEGGLRPFSHEGSVAWELFGVVGVVRRRPRREAE